jgi:hypothetical protein
VQRKAALKSSICIRSHYWPALGTQREAKNAMRFKDSQRFTHRCATNSIVSHHLRL